MNTSLSGKNIVITGASSGIGKATAFSLAAKGANLILGARRELLLEEVALECQKYGVKAFHYKTDVTSLDQVNNLFEFAIASLGSVDIWINNAGVGAVGEFTQTPIEVHEQVIKTNLMGHINSAYVIIPYFKNLNKGVLINNISLGAFVPNPFAAAYSASKFGQRGFSEALKYELKDYKDIHVCDVFPAFIDTPGFAHGANFTGKVIKPAP
ncbi:MAG: SDR family oxidoreductase, partial [Bdellovibrionales bacterium]|nr:SDR family oxidoreductase [Bdellovibrionales bacterium]